MVTVAARNDRQACVASGAFVFVLSLPQLAEVTGTRLGHPNEISVLGRSGRDLLCKKLVDDVDHVEGDKHVALTLKHPQLRPR